MEGGGVVTWFGGREVLSTWSQGGGGCCPPGPGGGREGGVVTWSRGEGAVVQRPLVLQHLPPH